MIGLPAWMPSTPPPNFFSKDQPVRIIKNGRTGTVLSVNHNNWFPYEVMVDPSYPGAKDGYLCTFGGEEIEAAGVAPTLAVAAPHCTCGSAKVNGPGHSSWCDVQPAPSTPWNRKLPSLF